MTRDDLLAALTHDNVQAFLRVLRAGESSNDDSAYAVVFGGDHFAAPPWEHPHRAVDAAGIRSTAAGAYQFLAKTWDGLVAKYGFEDFSPHNQDQGAVALIAGRSALDDVIAGRLEDAIAKCNKEWASLPGSPYGQPTRTLDEAREVFAAYGGRAGEPAIPDIAAAGSTAEPVDVAPAALQPQGVRPMGIFAALLPTILQSIPQLISVFGSPTDSEVAKRNQAAGVVVADTLVKATKAVNLQDAVERLQSDPQALQAAHAAVNEIIPQLVEAGDGGIASARAYGKVVADGQWWAFLCNPQFWLSLLLLGLVYMAMANVTGMYGYQAWTAENRSNVVFLIVGTAIGAVTGFWFGTSLSSQKKDVALGAKP